MTILMKRGEIWTSAGGSDYGAKSRPVVIIQDDRYDSTTSITVCPLTSHPQSTQVARLPVMPNDLNGLRLPCRLMVDKISTVPRNKLRAKIGQLDDKDMTRLNRSIIVFLGIAGMMPDEDPADE
jgi:mRNA interferase MazF